MPSILSTKQDLPGPTATKHCPHCHEDKPVTDFYNNKHQVDGLQYNCKLCQISAQKKRHLANPFKPLLCNCKNRARRKGWEFNLDEDYLRSIDRDICPYLEIPIYWLKGQGLGARQDNSKSLDRIDSAKGYIKGNVIICSNRANQILSNATAAEMALITVNFHRILND